MRFTEGHWAIRPGMTGLYPAEAYDFRSDGRTLQVFAPVKPIVTRGDTAGQALGTVTYTAHAPGVIGVRIEHHRGRPNPGPEFALSPADPDCGEVEVGPEGATLTAGPLSVQVRRGRPWHADFVADGTVLTSSREKSIGFLTDEASRHYVHEQLSLGVGTHVYGLGERFGAFVKNGQSVDMWNEDGGTDSFLSYKNVPFYVTDAGYGVFVRHSGRVSFEVGSERVTRSQFSVEGHALEYFLVYGPTPKEILERYTALTGRAPAVPDWSYGLWLTTSFITEYDEATVMSFVEGMAERGLPLSVFHFDCFWMREFNWCDFEWDPATFPDPQGMLDRMKARGLRICVWINPYIGQRSPLFDEGMAAGYLLRTPDGGVWQWDKWQAGMAIVDFTNPEARRWYQGYLRRLLAMGVDAFKTDFGERIPTDVVWHDGSDPERMHNYYAHLYNEVVAEVLREGRKPEDSLVFARSATAGGQQFPVHWGGDSEATYESMAESLRGGLSLAMSGFGYWSHDIGGFEGTPDPTLFKRWLAFGLLSSHSRLHGSRSYRVPWAFDEESVDVARKFTGLKMRLMPYLANAAQATVAHGTPVMRPMVLEFPEDPAVAHVDTQYMLGDGLLVAPVFSATGDARYYLPAGTWTHLLTGETRVGPGWFEERYAVDSLPVFVREGTVLPMGQRTDAPEYDWSDGVTLRLYELADGDERVCDVRAAGGQPGRAFTVARSGATYTVTTTDGGRPWSVEIVGVPGATVTGGQATVDRTELGVLISVPAGDESVTVTVDA